MAILIKEKENIGIFEEVESSKQLERGLMGEKNNQRSFTKIFTFLLSYY